MFHETWIQVDTLAEMRRLVQSVAHLDGDIVEFGVWEGRSTLILGAAAHPETVHAVDHWGGSPTLPIDVYAPGRDVKATFYENLAELGDGNIVVHEMSTAEFMATPRPVKFLHIDADHAYEVVVDEIRWGLANLVPGGVICGDDYSGNWPGVVRAVEQVLPQRELFNNMWWWRSGNMPSGG